MNSEDVFLKYGLPGVFILILLVAIKWGATLLQKIVADHKLEREELERLHRQERDEFRKTIERQFEDSNRTTTNATSALTELTTLLKSRK
jgi:hypothetical protein